MVPRSRQGDALTPTSSRIANNILTAFQGLNDKELSFDESEIDPCGMELQRISRENGKKKPNIGEVSLKKSMIQVHVCP